MIIFINEDEGYLRWIDQNPTGFVVNAARVPKPNYLILHRAICAHVATDERSNWTTNSYIKICSNNVEELRDWASRDVGGELRQCAFCNRELTVTGPPEIENALALPPRILQSNLFPVLWARNKELFAIDQLTPLKASWEKSTDVSQVRLREYRQLVRSQVSESIGSDELYLDLHVALSDSKQLLNGNDLENYLTPLFECGCLPAETFRLVSASKSAGGVSRLSIGTAVRENACVNLDSYTHLSVPPIV